jgi:hypothetical protein
MDRHSLLGGNNGVNDLLQALNKVDKEFRGFCNSVKYPTQDGFPRRPRGITFQELLKGGRLLVVRTIQLVYSSKDFVQSVQKCTLDPMPPIEIPMDDADKIIDVYVPLLQCLTELVTAAAAVYKYLQRC